MISVGPNTITYAFLASDTFIETEVFSIVGIKPFKKLGNNKILHCGWKKVFKKVRHEGGLR